MIVQVYRNNKKTLKKTFVGYYDKDEAIRMCKGHNRIDSKDWLEWSSQNIT